MRGLILITALLISLVGAAQAAWNIFQTRTGPQQIFYNIISDGGATCNGDLVGPVSYNVTTTVNNSTITVFGGPFTSGDINKTITIAGAGGGGGRYFGKITGVSGSVGTTQTLTTNTNANTALTNQSASIYYGTSDNGAFDAFNNWARANQGSTNQVVLTIPPASNCWFGNGGFNYINVFNAFAAGIKNLIVEGNGSTFNSVGGRGFSLGGSGTCQAGLTSASGCSARIQTANAGATQITLTSASLSAGYISRFPVGQWIMLGALDIQGLFQSPYGYPPNAQFFEWRQVTAVNAGTGVITLDRPLTNTYLSTYASYNSGNNFEADNGGPATIWAVGNSGGGNQNSWDSTVEYRGLTISQEGQTYANARNVTYRDVAFTGGYGGIPTQNETWSAINTDFGFANMETDKLVGTMLMDGVTIAQIVFQSSSTDLFIMRNSTVTTRLDGGGKVTEISDSTLNNWGPGIWAYGASSGASSCTRCTITTLNTQFGYSMIYSPLPYSMSGGLITMPNSLSEGQRPFVPNTRLFFTTTGYSTTGMWDVSTVSGDGWPAIDGQTATTNVTIASSSKNLGVSTSIFASGDVGKVIIVPGAGSGGSNLKSVITAFTDAQNVVLFDAASTSLSASSKSLEWGTSNTYMQTSAAGGFPDLSALNSAPIRFIVRNTPGFTCDVCIGDPLAAGSSLQAGAVAGEPLGSYFNRSFAPSASGNAGSVSAWGKFVSLTIDVTQAYTGTGSLGLRTGQFHLFTIKQSNWTQYDWVPSINLKQAGTRVITPSGITCNGVAGPCAGDGCVQPASGCYALPEAVWLQGPTFPAWIEGTMSGGVNPQFTITIQTDQSS